MQQNVFVHKTLTPNAASQTRERMRRLSQHQAWRNRQQTALATTAHSSKLVASSPSSLAPEAAQ